jgi:four helix bundle protein
VFCRELSKEPGVRRQIAGQLFRCGTSVGANAEEAKAAYSRKEFASTNNIVLREARESHYWLRVIEATELAPIAHFRHLLDEANELIAIYTTIVRKCRNS